MFVFFDTEFTDLMNPTLISIGFIAEDQATLYVELSGWSPEECSYFVLETVLPLLDATRRLSAAEAAKSITDWLQRQGDSVTLLSDATIDAALLERLLRVAGIPMPDNVEEAIEFFPSVDGDIVRENLYDMGLRRHHALDDAKALLASWRTGRAGDTTE